jgi:protein-S-isoprenylcysteine O-methyltransferase Ste14
MKLSALVFRIRYALHFVLFLLGFTAPWNHLVPLDPKGPNAHVWGILAANLAQVGVGSLAAPVFNPFNLLLGAGILCALAGAWLRTWGTAYLGSNIVKSSAMHSAEAPGAKAEGILTDGPFGYLRNPLYLGTFLHTLALSLLMPRSGAVFAILAIGGLQLWLIHGEEGFLTAKLGEPYKAYCALVPRLFPALRRQAAAGGLAPRWGQALLGEIYFWAVALSFAVAGWRYNASLLIQCVVVSVGVSVVARGFVGKPDRA